MVKYNQVVDESDGEFSDEEALLRASQKKRTSVQQRDPKNQLKLGEFHRNNISKKKARKPTLKKQLRDTMRLLERQGLPEEIKEAKMLESKTLKVNLKKQKEAVRFDLRYKKIKFVEKRKVIRKLEQLKKQLVSKSGDEELQREKKQYDDYLIYINHFPPLWKYISIFPNEKDSNGQSGQSAAHEASETYKKVFGDAMEKVLKMANVKRSIRDKELWEADNHDEAMEQVVSKQKAVEKVDPFFMNDADESNDENQVSDKEEHKPKVFEIEPEKRVVMRDGRVPKLTKNYDKSEKEKTDRADRRQFEYDARIQEREDKQEQLRREKPLKIKANRRDYVANTETKVVSKPAKQLNVKF